MKPFLPEQLPVFPALTPAADAAGRTSNYVSLKNAKQVVANFLINQGNAATVACSISQATNVAGAGAKALAAVSRIFATEDVSTAPVATQAASAANYTTSAALATKHVRIVIDPTTLDLANGFDCIALVTGASNVANITAAWLEIDTKYAQVSPLSPRVN